MAWVTPPTFVSGNVLTAAQMNILSGDLNETPAAKATGAQQYFMATAANVVAARQQSTAIIMTLQTTTSIGYANIGTLGPQVNITTGTSALVFFGCKMFNSVAFGVCFTAINVSGTSTSATSDTEGIYSISANATDYNRHSGYTLYDGNLTAGSGNIFTQQYRVSGGTGSFDQRRMTVFPL